MSIRKKVTSTALAVGSIAIIVANCQMNSSEYEEKVLLEGKIKEGKFTFIETPHDVWNGREYKLVISKKDGSEIEIYDNNQDGEVDVFPESYTQKQAQDLYNSCVSKKYLDSIKRIF